MKLTSLSTFTPNMLMYMWLVLFTGSQRPKCNKEHQSPSSLHVSGSTKVVTQITTGSDPNPTGWSCIGSKGFCHQKCHFLCVKKCKFRQKFCHKSRISPVFSHPKMGPYQQCVTVNWFYEVLQCQNSSRLLASTFLKKKTGDCWILDVLNSCSLCLEPHCELADH